MADDSIGHRSNVNDQLSVGADGQVYRAIPNDPPIEDDWGSSVLVPPGDLLKAAQRFLSDDLLCGALDIQAND